MQLIEGDCESVWYVMEYVKCDLCYEQLCIVIEGYKQWWIFFEWSMGFSNLDWFWDEFDFSVWGQCYLMFFDLVEDVYICYNYIWVFGSYLV